MVYSSLFSPLQVGNLKLRNRVVMAPMSSNLGTREGTVSEGQIAYYRERAAGGVGMVTVEYTCVDSSEGLAKRTQLRLDDSKYVAGHARLAETIKRAGAAACVQLQHSGRQTNPDLIGGRQAVAPSPFLSSAFAENQMARALEPDEIDRLIERFARSAALAVQAGYDAVELHGAHSYLLANFLSPFTNRRDDEWGGDFERRLAFPCAVIRAVKRELGSALPLIYRFSAAEFVEGGLAIEDSVRIAPRLAEAGVDILHVSTGVKESGEYSVEPMSSPEGWRLPLARRIRAASGVPVTAVGQIRWPAMADQAITDGDADLIALGRPLLADPEWANKAREGREQDIRPCTSCNWCRSKPDTPSGFGCAENPRAGSELDRALPMDVGKGQIAVVVGGGPGGIAAALLLDYTGFAVHMFEKRPDLGGSLISAAAPPNKDKLFWYLRYLKGRLAQSTVTLHLGTSARTKDIVALSPALVVLATGGVPLPLSVPGGDGPTVRSAYDFLIEETVHDGCDYGRVVVYGGGETGCETAELIAARGGTVVLVTRSSADDLARNAESTYRRTLLRNLKGNPKIQIMQQYTLDAIRPDSVLVSDTAGAETQIPADLVLIAQGRVAASEIEAQLQARGIKCHVIGDSRRVRRIGDAVHDAYRMVQRLTETEPPIGLAC